MWMMSVRVFIRFDDDDMGNEYAWDAHKRDGEASFGGWKGSDLIAINIHGCVFLRKEMGGEV